MLNSNDSFFYEYFSEWIDLYKVGAVRDVTLAKYHMSLQHLKRIASTVKVSELDRKKYQKILNSYAETHEKQTTTDFHHQLKGAISDAVDEGLIPNDPTRKIVIKGKSPSKKRQSLLVSLTYRS